MAVKKRAVRLTLQDFVSAMLCCRRRYRWRRKEEAEL